MSLVIVGGGNMGEALLSGLFEVGFSDLAVVERAEDRRAHLATRFPSLVVTSELGPGDDAIIAVKPTDVEAACGAIGARSFSRVLSIAAGVRLASLKGWLGRPMSVARAMPNTPALIGRGITAVASDDGDAALAWAETLLVSVGPVVRVEEHQLDAVTAVSGSGPAYVFLLAEAMYQGALDEGLPTQVADLLVRETVAGAGLLLAQSDDEAKVLRQRVTSPGGTTAAAIDVLQSHNFEAHVEQAIKAARKRAEELGKGAK